MRYKAIFKDNSQYSLFGEAFFADKRVFWLSHQANLIGFRLEVCSKGRPVKVLDTIDQLEIIFSNDKDFDLWYSQNQSPDLDFGCSQLTIPSEIIDELKKRIKQILDFLKEELSNLEKKPLNLWRIDGGYKELEKMLLLAQKSAEIIESKNPEISKLDAFQKIKSILSIPRAIKVDGHDIITFSKQTHEKLGQSKLIDLCRLNIKQISERNSYST